MRNEPRLLVRAGLPSSSWPRLEKVLPPEALIHRNTIATLEVQDDWVFETFSWSIRSWWDQTPGSSLDWVESVYASKCPSRRLTLRTWVDADLESLHFPGDLVAEHLFDFLQQEGLPLADALGQVERANRKGFLTELRADTSASSFVIGQQRVTAARGLSRG